LLAGSGEEAELRRISCNDPRRQSCFQANSHCVPSGDRDSAMLKRALALVGGNVVVGMSRTAMEGARGQPNASRKFVQFLDAICHEVEPSTTVLQDLGVVDVYHLQFSLLLSNLTFCDMYSGAGFPGPAMVESVATALRSTPLRNSDHWAHARAAPALARWIHAKGVVRAACGHDRTAKLLTVEKPTACRQRILGSDFQWEVVASFAAKSLESFQPAVRTNAVLPTCSSKLISDFPVSSAWRRRTSCEVRARPTRQRD